MFQAAVAGPPLAQDPNVQLITDSLRDFLRPDETEVRLLVPVVGHSLSTGVQAVIEWAWERDIKVDAIYEQTNDLTAIENQFLEDADDTTHSLDAAQTIALILKQAMPNACLIVAPFGEDYDEFTRSLMNLCFEHEIPVYDLSSALIEIDPYDSWEDDGGSPTEEEKPEETAEKPQQPQEEDDERFPAADLFAELERIERRADAGAKTFIDIRDRARAIRTGQPAAPRESKERHGTEISHDKGATWEDRKRGRARAGSIERDKVTKEIIRRN